MVVTEPGFDVTESAPDVTERSPQATVAPAPQTIATRDAARRQAKREKNRLRQERHRQRRADAALRAAAAEAERIEREDKDREARAEKLAPNVLRKPIVAPAVKPTLWHPDGRPKTMLVGARVQIVDGRPVRSFGLSSEDDPVIKLARENKAITPRHTDAARQLQLDWEDVGGGLGLGAVDYLRTGGGGGSGAIDMAMLAQAAIRTRLDGAMAYLGAFAPAVARIVLDCVPVYVWAEQTGKDMAQAIAWLVLALDRLAGFYSPEQRAARAGIRTLAPSRASYAIDLPLPDGADA